MSCVSNATWPKPLAETISQDGKDKWILIMTTSGLEWQNWKLENRLVASGQGFVSPDGDKSNEAKFDRVTYQREYMRRYRAKGKK